MICKYCGAEIFDNSKFCLKCGKGINGEVNPSDREQAKVQFKKDILPICRRYSRSLNNDREVDSSYAKYVDSADSLKNYSSSTTDMAIIITLIAGAILIAVFSFLITGLNLGNKNFHWIIKDSTFALILCSATGYIPLYALYMFLCTVYNNEYDEFNFGHIIKSVIIGLIGGVVTNLILAFLSGFFGKFFKAVCIILAVALVLFAAFLIFRVVVESSSREQYSSKEREIAELRAAYEHKFNNEIKPYREKYKHILSDDELDQCIMSAKSAITTQNLEEVNKMLNNK